jgi:orotidine-5'-phosphate decarboxylase
MDTQHAAISPASPRDLPAPMADRLIVALDVPTIAGARDMVARLDGVVSFFKVGLWLAFAEGVDGLLHSLTSSSKKVFLDAKMYDIGRTVREGVARAADRGVHILTVHGDARIMEAAVKGKGSSHLKIFAISVLTSLDDAALKEMGYALTARDLIHLRAKQAVQIGCDGMIASAADDPNELRLVAGSDRLLIGTPGIRGPEDPTDDHARLATPAAAIERGSDYLVVGRPIIGHPDPVARARQIIAEMEAGGRHAAGHRL